MKSYGFSSHQLANDGRTVDVRLTYSDIGILASIASVPYAHLLRPFTLAQAVTLRDRLTFRLSVDGLKTLGFTLIKPIARDESAAIAHEHPRPIKRKITNKRKRYKNPDLWVLSNAPTIGGQKSEPRHRYDEPSPFDASPREKVPEKELVKRWQGSLSDDAKFSAKTVRNRRGVIEPRKGSNFLDPKNVGSKYDYSLVPDANRPKKAVGVNVKSSK